MVSYREAKQWFDDHYFEIMVVGTVILIIGMAVYRWMYGLKGSMSDSFLGVGAFVSGTKRGGIRGRSGGLDGSGVGGGGGCDSKGERECRRVLQYLFGRPFDKARPDFLRNPVTGGRHNMELDCYDSSLRLAVEYDGEQHYKYIPYFHGTKASFENQKYRDLLKSQMCESAGVHLIRVPYTVKLENIKSYLEKELRMAGYQV